MKLGKGHKIKLNFCPVCGHPLDGASNAEGEDILPEEGDFSICIVCATPLCFNADLTLRTMTPDDWKDAPKEFLQYLLFMQNFTSLMKNKDDF